MPALTKNEISFPVGWFWFSQLNWFETHAQKHGFSWPFDSIDSWFPAPDEMYLAVLKRPYSSRDYDRNIAQVCNHTVNFNGNLWKAHPELSYYYSLRFRRINWDSWRGPKSQVTDVDASSVYFSRTDPGRPSRSVNVLSPGRATIKPLRLSDMGSSETSLTGFG